MNGPIQKCVIDRKIRIRKVTGKYVTNVVKSFLKEHFNYIVWFSVFTRDTFVRTLHKYFVKQRYINKYAKLKILLQIISNSKYASQKVRK